MADPVVKFEPYMTAREPGGSLILDRNLIEIKKALADANATFTSIKNTINEIVNGGITINITGATGARGIQGLDALDTDDGQPGLPGRPGIDGLPGRPGIFGLDGDDGLDGLPGQVGQAGIAGAFGRAGIDGQDGDDAGGFLPIAETSGIPLGALASEYTTTGDVATVLNGDSRIRTKYSRVCVGPYTVNDPAILAIEDNAVLGVF